MDGRHEVDSSGQIIKLLVALQDWTHLPSTFVGLQSWLPARELVQKAIDGRHEVDGSGQIIKLPVAGCPWKEHLAQLEEELKLGDAIKYCIYEVKRRLSQATYQLLLASRRAQRTFTECDQQQTHETCCHPT